VSHTATSALTVSDWEEAPVDTLDSGTSLTRATSRSEFSGQWQGTGLACWILVYTADGAARFVGTQAFSGALDGRTGTFVLQLQGTFEENTAKVSWSVLPGTGTGELAGLTGSGGYESVSDAPSASATLAYDGI
jgi:hypothetical protein